MPHSRDDLGDDGVAEVEVLDKGQNAGSVVSSPSILVASFNKVTKEGGVPH